MISGLKLTAKFVGKTTVDVTVQNLNTMTVYKLMWDFAKPADQVVSDDIAQEEIELINEDATIDVDERSEE